METNIFTYFSALGSVAFGWLLNELGLFFKTRREEKRIKKKVLFNLLETLYTFKQLDFSKDIELITEKVLIRLPKETQTDEGRQLIKLFYKSIISDLTEKNVSANLIELEESYKKSIEELSSVDPISAYRLKGKNKILQTFDLLYKYFDEAKVKFPEESNVLNSQSENAFEIIKPELIKSSIEDLIFEIKSISLKIGIGTRLSSNIVLKKLNITNNNDILNNKIDELLDKLIPNKIVNN